ncbi:GTPase Era [Mycoplasma phocimorsus]|uniref:GTPase Era n=1 Tax=Mycoplasma phocimorsus TaxID=3045839 RepID=UPI0024C0474F|nr:GTPase Era [Mycoplasma phocimorsus]MDJ1649160.1 GTPase Era [Mycoplasma phocimorsus]
MKICFATIIGRPNVGKSTLLNKLLNFETAITSPVAQTTRDQILGVYTNGNLQIVFTDTPGIHKPQNKLGEKLNKNAIESLEDIDLVMFLTPINEPIGKGDLYILDLIKNIKNKVAIITKTDLNVSIDKFQEKERELKELGFNEIWMFNDKMQGYSNLIIEKIEKYAYEGAFFYDEDTITDKPLRFFASEIIRKYANENLRDELPHSISVQIDEFNEGEEFWDIFSTIYVKKESQKGIIIGKAGSMIKKIGTEARKHLENQFGVKVNLNLKVKVNKNWVDNEKQLKQWGY